MKTRVLSQFLAGVLTVTIPLAAYAQGPPGRGRGRMCAQQNAMAQAPIASNPVVDVKGKITKVQIAPGTGMPFLEIDQNGQSVKVFLGSMRYLMQQNFNPKAGEEVEVKGYKGTDWVVASAVTLVTGNRTLKLRDDKGFPVWGGCGGMGGCPHCGQ